MARPLRVDVAGGWYHVTARGNERKAVFRDERDRRRFLELLGQLVERFGLRLHAFVLLDNHYHLLVETPRANLSAAMQWLGGGYAVGFNRRHGRAGHLFQGRFKAVLLEESEAVEVSRYVHLNPVRVRALGLDKAAQVRAAAGGSEPVARSVVAERLMRLRQWRWSSYKAYAGLAERPDWLTIERVLELGGGRTRADRQRAYRQFVEEPIREGHVASPWERLEAGVLLGGAEFVRRWRKRARGQAREQPQLRQLQRRVEFAAVVAVVERLKGEKWEVFRDRHGDWGRDLALYVARRHCGLALRRLAEAVGGVDYSSVSKAVDRFAQQMQQSKHLQTLLARAKAELSNV